MYSLSVFLPPSSLSLYSSGLSFEESKELTKADVNQESARPRSPSHQTGPAAQAPVDPKGTKDSSQTDAAAAAAAAVKDTKAAQRETVATTEPMKTRRSQYAEDRKLNAAAQSVPTPAVKTPEVERQTERAAAGTLPDKEHKEEVKEEKAELPQSPVKSHPPQASSELKEDQPVSVVKPAEESEEVISEPSGPSEPLKRKSLSEVGDELTPEKRPRMSSVSSVSSVSPPASSISSPATPTSATSQRVPPLKVGKMSVNGKVSSDLSVSLSLQKKSPLADL